MKSDCRYVGWFYVLSHPSRGAWIEIAMSRNRCRRHLVAPLTGCVD